MGVLLAALVSASFMAGVSWFVGVVHYPLFSGVGAGDGPAYHRRHSDRTTLVVVVPMVAELTAAAWIAVALPRGVASVAALAGLALAATAWLLTVVAARLHGRLGDALEPGLHRGLLGVHHVRTAVWSAHALLAAALVAAAA